MEELPLDNSHVRKKSWRWKENVLAVCIAAGLSFFLYHGASQYGLLSADITGGPQVEFNDMSDIVVSLVDEGNIEVFAGKSMEEVVDMSFVIIFDPEQVKLDNGAFRSQFSVTYAPAGTGKGILALQNTNKKTISVKESLFSLSLVGASDALVIGDALVNFADGSKESLSVQLPR